MKHNFLVLFFFLILFSSVVFAADYNIKKIKVGVYDNPPKIFIDEKGNVSGFFADLIEEIARKENWNIEYVYGSWNEGLKRLETGEIDIMVDVAFSEDRAKLYEFNNETVFINWGVIYSNKNIDIQSFTDLDEKKIAVMNESIHTTGPEGIINLAKEFEINIEIIEVADYKTVLELTNNGLADAGVVNRIYGETYAVNYDLKKTPIIFNPSQLKFAFPKNNVLNNTLIEKIDKNLKEMKADKNSVYYNSQLKYITDYVGTVEKIPEWIYILLVCSGIIIVILIVSASIFKKQRDSINKNKLLLEKANNLKDLFIDIMRHDLLNPAGVIKMDSELVLEKEKDPKNKELLSVVHNQSSILIERIKNASLLSKLDEGKEKMEFIKLNLTEIIKSVINEVSLLAKEKNIKLISKIDKEICIKGSPLLYDVFFNLITNAIKYSPKGSQVIIESNETETKHLISVIDSGEGIPDKYKKSIFERFIRLEKGGIKGSGLGLAITKKIVELNNGKVWVKDNSKCGSIFIVEFNKLN
ncbi:MAG: transporter substrate-binding domain-containing protein [Candidatus Diapherotrites archaeon]|nr:transporter substrate-binding domain-containing protein [Candidatus Diapherotrites archaeon]